MEKIMVWDFGPVVPEAYREYKQFGSCNIPDVTTDDECCILEKDRELINAVVDRFAEYSATDLVALTQSQTPWTEAFVPHAEYEIKLDAIKEYFIN